MAGAGYKLFNTGDVLTAAQVNTYLQEQTVMVFANATARTTALASVLSEGMVSYLKDTDVVEIYTGAAWVSLDDPNAIQNSIVDAKGDLISATADNIPARLAVGSNGDTLISDSSQTTGLRWGANYGFAAGKNKIINGAMDINQRAWSSSTTVGTYLFDRFSQNNSGGTVTFSAQTFTAGAAPVAGYEAKNYIRIVTSGQTTGNFAILQNTMESVRTLAGQTATVSFWAKANTGTPNINARLRQNFGTGGSPSTSVNTLGTAQAITTSWARYSFTIAIPSISGKTLGTDGNDNLLLGIIVSDDTTLSSGVGIQNNTFEIWGVQLEAGSVATAFQTATGTLAGELAACQRYYERWSASGNGDPILMAQAISTSAALGGPFFMKVRKRTTSPTITYSNNTHFGFTNSTNSSANTGSLDSSVVNADSFRVYASSIASSPLTAGNASFVNANTSSAYIEMSSEL